MPIYEYACTHCGATLESLQRITDAPLVSCQSCGQDTLERLVSAAGFRLKGSGWYETDFKTPAEKQRNLASTETAKAEAGTAASGAAQQTEHASTNAQATTTSTGKERSGTSAGSASNTAAAPIAHTGSAQSSSTAASNKRSSSNPAVGSQAQASGSGKAQASAPLSKNDH